MLGSSGGRGGQAQQGSTCVCACVCVHACVRVHVCVFMHARVRGCNPGGGEREVGEGVSWARKGWKWSGRGCGSGVSMDHPLSSHSLYSTTHCIPGEAVSPASVGERQGATVSWGKLCIHPHASPLSRRGEARPGD